MGRVIASVLVAVLCATTFAPAQTRRSTPAPAPQRGRATKPPAPPPTVKIAPLLTCPAPLGAGVKTGLAFCDVLTVRDPAEGIVIPMPPHDGPVTLTFDLHNRHTYSEEQERAGRGFARYTASIGVMAMDVTLLTRAVVQNEYRKPADLLDRVGGGAGPSGLKAVAPTGVEHVTVLIREEEMKVSIMGEKLTVERFDSSSATYATIGRPIAVVSNVMVEFRPPPPPPTAPAAGRRGRL
jgi:hypothetical protein